MPIKDMDAPPLPDDMAEQLRVHNDYLYLFFDKPIEGIKLDFTKPGPNAMFTDLDYQEEEEEIELEPITIEFSL